MSSLMDLTYLDACISNTMNIFLPIVSKTIPALSSIWAVSMMVFT